jgi:lactoylglutathione lyase
MTEEPMAKAVHSMIRVLEENRSREFYKIAFGLDLAEEIDFESFKLIYLRNEEADFEVELTVNKGRKDPYDLGDGYGHLAVVVDNLASEHARLTAAGLTPTKLTELGRDGKLVGRFFFLADPDGYKIEVIERGGRFR